MDNPLNLIWVIPAVGKRLKPRSFSWDCGFFLKFWRYFLILNINGEEHETKSSRNLEELVKELEIKVPHFAVALNYQVVPKSQYNSVNLKEGDKIEIVHAVGGGI